MWSQRINYCTGSRNPQPKAVSIIDIQGGLYLLLLGVSIALLVLAAEMICSKRAKVKLVMNASVLSPVSKIQTLDHQGNSVSN